MLSGGQNYFSGNDGKPEVLFLKVKMDLIYSECLFLSQGKGLDNVGLSSEASLWQCSTKLY